MILAIVTITLPLFIVALPNVGVAQPQKQPSSAPTTQPATVPLEPVRPPPPEPEDPDIKPNGFACRQCGSGTRAPGDPMPLVAVLAPLVDGFTTVDRPQLFWYVSEDVKYSVEIAFLEDDPKIVEPAFPPIHLAAPITAGIHRVELPSGFQMQKGKQYEWIVAVIPDSQNRSQDLLASALVRKSRRPAAKGYWYDNFAAHAERYSTDLAAREACIEMLNAVGLTEVAHALSQLDKEQP